MLAPRFRDYLEAWESLGPEDQAKALSYMGWLRAQAPMVDPYEAGPGDSGTHPTVSINVRDTKVERPEFTGRARTSKVDVRTIDRLLAQAELAGRRQTPSEKHGCRDCGAEIVGNYCVGCGRPVHWERV